MNLGNLSQIILVISSLVAIPLISGNITLNNNYKSGLIASLNYSGDNYEYNGFYSVKKEVYDEKEVYTYSTPYGRFKFSFSPEKFEAEVSRIGRRVHVTTSYSQKIYELWEPEKYLKINQTPFRIESYLKTPYGSLVFISEAGRNSTQFSGSLSENELMSILRESEKTLYQEVEIIQNFTEDILGIRKLEISYLHCKGGNETEFVEIKNNRMISVNLKDYELRDTVGDTSSYVFPDLILYPGETVKLFRNVTGITWNDQENETAVLLTPEGKITSQRKCDEY